MPSWPSTLPGLSIDLEEAPRANLLVTEMEVGPPKRRLRTSTVSLRVAVPMHVTGAQRATLLTFFDTTCAGGVTAFTWIDPATGSAATYAFRARPTFRLVVGNATKAGMLWSTTLELDRLP